MFGKLKSFITKTFGNNSIYGLYNSSSTRLGSFAWTRGKSLSLYEKSLFANKAIQKRAEKVGQIQFILKDKRGNIIEDNEWTRLLDRPSKKMTGDMFWRTVQKYYDIVGACYITADYGDNVFNTKKIPEELQILRADLVEVVYNQDQSAIKCFRYTPEGGNSRDYEPAEVIYLYNPNPRRPLEGESLLSSAVRAIETEVQIEEYHASVLKNGGKLETIFKIKNPLNGTQLTELEEQYKDKYAEAKSAGRPLFLGGDIDIEKTALSPQELAYLDTKVKTIDDLVFATGVPKALLGVTSGETFANADASIRIFLRETIKPLMDNLVNVLDWQLIPMEFDLTYVDPTPEDTENTLKKIEVADKVHALTINEKREMLGYKPVKGGDVIMQPFNLVEMGTETEKSVQKKNFVHPLQDAEYRRMYAKIFDKRNEKKKARMLREVREYFKGQEERLMSYLGEAKSVKKKSLFGDAFNATLEINIAKNTLLPLLRELFKEAGEEAMSTFDLGEFNYTSFMDSAIERRAELFSNSIIATTSDQLQKVFNESFEQGEGRQDLVKRINELYTNISKGRAETIARTEVHHAVQEANLEAYKQAGLPIKIWVTVGDDRVREEHRSIDGEERPINMPFSNGLQYPSEINCRCTI